MHRHQMATKRLAQVKSASPEKRAQAIDSWLELATRGEVRRNWRAWMGPLPGWAK